MTHRLLVLALLFCSPAVEAQPQGSQKAAEPFASFRALDKSLSLLDTQLVQADAVLQKTAAGAIATSSGKRARAPWNAISRQIFINVRSIDGRTNRLRRRYRATKSAQPLFAGLMKSEVQLMASARSLQSARTIARAQAALQHVQQARLDFVLAFHALTSDYGALRCPRKSWACCEIVRQNGGAACRWSCVKAPRQCTKGLLGPQSTAASADVIRH
jgi:hypothetical protein